MVSDGVWPVVIVVGLVALSVVFVGVASASEHAALGDEPVAQTDDSDLEVVSVDVPDTMEPGEQYTISTTVRNTVDSAKQVRVGYVFAGDLVFFETVIIPAGGQQTKEFTVSLDDVTEEYPGTLTDGTYEHGIRAGDAEETQSVQIQGVGTPTETATPERTVREGEAVAENDELTFVGNTVPEVIQVDRTTQLSARIKYTGTERIRLNLVFRVDGVPTFAKEFAVDPGETVRVQMQFDSTFLETDDGELEDGEVYDWQLTAQQDTRTGADDLRILAETGGQFGYGVDPGSVADASGTDEGRTRGFFSNSSGGSAFLGNAFNVTILGFLLSVAGILHQMLGGR